MFNVAVMPTLSLRLVKWSSNTNLKLSTAQSSLQVKDCEHQQAIQKLQDKIQLLELSLASQVNLPSVGGSHNGSGLQDEVFNFIPGTVNRQ